MEIILPAQHNYKKFLECAAQIQYDEFNAKMFVFFEGSSDVDVYQLIPDDRILQLIYGWNVCRLHNRDSISEELAHIVRVLMHHTLQLLFSHEWIGCSNGLKRILLYYVSKSYRMFNNIRGLCDIDWQYILNLQQDPWQVPYLQQLFGNLMQNKQHVIEHAVPVATVEDVTYLRQERLHLIVLRLLKLFDAGSWEAVKQLSLRVLAAWLKCNPNSAFSQQSEYTAIILVGHLYLLTVFVADDNRGYVIDNMMYNIRFYAQSMRDAAKAEALGYTPSRLIAHVCVRLGLGKDGFFEYIVFKKFNLNLVTPFAVMMEAYTSYVVGNQLLELMAMNEHDFMAHIAQFKVLMHRYMEEREKSERFLLNELQKLECQRNSHALPYTVNLNLNYQQQICKGNRASNIGNYKNCDENEMTVLDVDDEPCSQIDPVFQNLPNNEEVLDFVYKLLAKRKFQGWQFAKIVLLLKIIGQKLNAIEVWRYHPGLTTEFMLNLEQKLSDNFADLAKIFPDHGFMEAEFWLTAFYLHPTRSNYNEVKRCSRIKRKRKDEDEVGDNKSGVRTEKLDLVKYELLSSTIDVDEIVANTNHDEPMTDYDPIQKALQTLRLPRSILNDLLTVAFQPRNKRYSWALDWNTLHERCSILLKNTDLKKKFVALNMAEANDSLQFLKIDYDKYKNRPQLDYGTIEEGYENAVNTTELSADEDDETPKAAREKAERDRKRHRIPCKFWEEVLSDEDEEDEQESDESEAYYTDTGRRTRVRAAAVVANAMITDIDRTMRSGRHSPISLASTATSEALSEQRTLEAQQLTRTIETSKYLPVKPKLKRSLCELLQSQTMYTNETSGFKAFADIWSYDKGDQFSVVADDNMLMESNTLLEKFRTLRGLRGITGDTSFNTKNQADVLSETQSSRSVSRNSSETDSLQSGTSTMAMHDANEFLEEESGESKVYPPTPMPTSDFTMGTKVFQLRRRALAADGSTVRKKLAIDAFTIPATVSVHLERLPAMKPVKGRAKQTRHERTERKESSGKRVNNKLCSYPEFNLYASDNDVNDLNARLIRECLTRQVMVHLNKLTFQDIEKLRRVRVRVKRTNLNNYYREQAQQTNASSNNKLSISSTDDSSTSTSDLQRSGASKYKKHFVHITSDSIEPSTHDSVDNPQSDKVKSFKHITSDASTSTDPEEKVQRQHGSKWSIIKSKLKEAASQKDSHVTGAADVIELSSDSTISSSLSASPVPVTVSRFPDVVLPLDLDPLYEEEIVPF